MPNSLDANTRVLLTTLVTRGPLTEYAIAPAVLAQALQDGHVMRINFEGVKVIPTESGYREALVALGLTRTPQSAALTRALEDLAAVPGIRQVDVVRRLITDACEDIGTQQMLWMTYHTDGQYREFHQQYTELALSPNSAKDAAYHALCFIHGLRPLLSTGWESDRGGIEHSLRYPNIRRVYDEDDGAYEYAFCQLTFEHYCDPTVGDVITVGADWGHDAMAKVPPVPFVQFYADPNGRVPVNTLDSHYMSEERDVPTVFLETALVLPEAMAQEVAREATRVIESSYNQYPNNHDAAAMLRRMRRPVSPYVMDAVEYALRTKPATPVTYGSFELVPITVMGDHTPYFEVCWVIPVYKKRSLTVRRIGGRNVRLV